MCIHSINGSLYNYEHFRVGNKVCSIYLGPVSGSSYGGGSIGGISSGYGTGLKDTHAQPSEISKETLEQLKTASLDERKKIIENKLKVKPIEIKGSKVESFFDGNGEVINQTWKDEKGQVFKLPTVSPIKQREKIYTTRSMQHPAKMYAPLAQKLVQEYTKPRDTILDPMAGIGTTGIEASRLGRNAVMVDYEKRFVKDMRKNEELLKKSGQKIGRIRILHGDARKLGRIGSFDAIITSPPFADSQPFHDKRFLKKMDRVQKGSIDSYSTKKNTNNIGMMKGDKYFDEMNKAYKEYHRVLKPSGKMIIHMKNSIKNKKVVPLDKQTIKVAEQNGFRLKEHKKRKLDNFSFWTTQYRRKYPNAPKINYEDVLVFSKK